MKQSEIPEDSLLHHWVRYLSASEVPLSYQVAAGLSAIGCLLKRQRWIDQVEWRVYPNQPVLFIGPSGIGKDTIINRTQQLIEKFNHLTKVPVLGGVTMEYIHARLSALSKPACAYLPAPEMTAFFGKADYQANLLTGMTNLLSSGEKVDISTKGGFNLRSEPTYILQPTVTMHGGSTVEWLHKSMPDGTMEGGFLGRFLIIVEEFGARHVPLVKSEHSQAQLKAIRSDLDQWHLGVEEIIHECQRPREVILLDEAEDYYRNWYCNRFKYFSKTVIPYANRSRDMVLRIAMLMAITRKHYRWIELCDIEFAVNLLHFVANRIDKVVLPPTDEAKCATQILTLMPAMTSEIYSALAVRYPSRVIEAALNILTISKRVKFDRQRGVYSAFKESN